MSQPEATGSLATAPKLERLKIASIDPAEVLRYLGYRGQEITPELEGRLLAGMEHCLASCEPAGVWRVFDLDPARGSGALRLLGASLELPGESIAGHLAGAKAAALLTVTLGLRSERELQRLSLVDPLEQLIFDASATALVERAADALESRVVAYAAQHGLYTNDRFAPGYGDLPLTVQPQVIEVLNARRLLGMSLTPSNMLVPTKSETAVVGIFDFIPERREGGLCSSCAMYDFCSIRGSGRTCRSA